MKLHNRETRHRIATPQVQVQVHNQADSVKIGSILYLNLNLKLSGHISTAW